MIGRFDAIFAVDWSARGAPSPAKVTADALWIGLHDRSGPAEPRYFRTRAAAMDWLAAAVALRIDRGERVLAGFDFAFGYPRGVAARLTGRPEALALWAWIEARLTDGRDNANNRFAVAAEANRALGGPGPFWGRPRRPDLPEVPERKSDRAPMTLPEMRRAEMAAPGAKSVWQLAYAGAVGGQALTGIAALERLRRDPRLAGRTAVWPFETGLAPGAAPVVFAEIYPGLLRGRVAATRRAGEIRDAAEARVTAAAFAALDARGGLAALFAGAAGLDPAEAATIAREEGWILGAGHAAALAGV